MSHKSRQSDTGSLLSSSGSPLLPSSSLRNGSAKSPTTANMERNQRLRSAGVSRSADYGKGMRRASLVSSSPFDNEGDHPIASLNAPAPLVSSMVDVLKEKLRSVMQERDAFAAELEKHKKLTRATRVAELETTIEMLSKECERHIAVQQKLYERMQAAEKTAEAALEHAKESTAMFKSYMGNEDLPPEASLKLQARHTMSPSKTQSTLNTLRAAHGAVLSQAISIKKNCAPPGGVNKELTMAEFADRADKLGSNFIGAVDVLRYLQVHVRRILAEMQGLPGTTALVSDISMLLDKRSGAAAYPYTVFLARQTGTLQELGFSLGDHVNQLRNVTSQHFAKSHTLYKSDVQQVNDMAGLLVAEVTRLQTPPPDDPTEGEGGAGTKDSDAAPKPSTEGQKKEGQEGGGGGHAEANGGLSPGGEQGSGKEGMALQESMPTISEVEEEYGNETGEEEGEAPAEEEEEGEGDGEEGEYGDEEGVEEEEVGVEEEEVGVEEEEVGVEEEEGGSYADDVEEDGEGDVAVSKKGGISIQEGADDD